MSVHVSSWAWKQKLGNPGLKLVLVKLADNADQNGYSYWKQDRLADECEMSRSTVQRKIKDLTDLGYVEVVERKNGQGFRVANGYRIKPPRSLRQSDAALPHNGEAAGASTVTQHEPSQEPGPPPPPRSGRAPTQVGGKRVSATEEQFAVTVLGIFNGVSGRRFGSKEALGKIVLRHREHPDLTVEDHERVIREQFERPWWKGDPSPSVIYGNGEVFDRAVNGVAGSRSGQDNAGDDGLDYLNEF